MPDRQSLLMRATNPAVARLYGALRFPRTPPFPRSLVLETTSRCNLACRMCPRQTMRREARDMDPGLFARLVEQAADHQGKAALRFLALHWFGEPLLHPELLSLIECAGSRLPGLRAYGRERNAVRGLSLSTNATLLDEQAALSLLDSPLTWLAVSVDGSNQGTYEGLRQGACFAEGNGKRRAAAGSEPGAAARNCRLWPCRWLPRPARARSSPPSASVGAPRRGPWPTCGSS